MILLMFGFLMILQKLSRRVTCFFADEEVVRLQHTVNVLDAVFKTVENRVRDAVDGALSPHVFGVKFHIFLLDFIF